MNAPHQPHCRCLACDDARNAPHPDTARADAAERLLAGAMASMEHHSKMIFAIAIAQNTGLESWWSDWQARNRREEYVARLAGRLKGEASQAAATRRELEGLTPCAK